MQEEAIDKELFVYDADSYEKDVLGAYKTGAFDIYLSGRFSTDFSSLSRRDLGTFVHEYVHFLQNVSTPWGIQAGIVRNNDIAEMVHSYESKDEIHIPYRFEPSDNQMESRRWLQCSVGTGRENLRIDQSRPTSFRIVEVEGMPIRIHKVYFKFYAQDNQEHEIIIGATIIKESMAVMIQSYVEPDMPKHPDVPYNVIELLCRNHFPLIADDKKKLIQLCYISLFSLDPGMALLYELKHAHLNPDMSGEEIFAEFVSGDFIVNGKSISKVDSFDDMLKNYSKSIRGILPCELHYIGYVLSEIRKKLLMPPLLGLIGLIDKDPSVVSKLVGWLGIPYIHTGDGTQFYLQKEDDKHFFQDVVILAGNAEIYDYVCQSIKRRLPMSCPFSYMCDTDTYICDVRPWENKDCIFSTGIDSMKLSAKRIINDREKDA